MAATSMNKPPSRYQWPPQKRIVADACRACALYPSAASSPTRREVFTQQQRKEQRAGRRETRPTKTAAAPTRRPHAAPSVRPDSPVGPGPPTCPGRRHTGSVRRSAAATSAAHRRSPDRIRSRHISRAIHRQLEHDVEPDEREQHDQHRFDDGGADVPVDAQHQRIIPRADDPGAAATHTPTTANATCVGHMPTACRQMSAGEAVAIDQQQQVVAPETRAPRARSAQSDLRAGRTRASTKPIGTAINVITGSAKRQCSSATERGSSRRSWPVGCASISMSSRSRIALLDALAQRFEFAPRDTAFADHAFVASSGAQQHEPAAGNRVDVLRTPLRPDRDVAALQFASR